MKGIEERLDTESIARCEESAIALVPENERELTSQVMQTLAAEILVKVKGDFAIGPRAETVTAGLEIALDALVVVELAVDDDVGAVVLRGDGLVAGHEIYDAEPSVAQSDVAIRRDPVALTVGTAVIKALSCALKA